MAENWQYDIDTLKKEALESCDFRGHTMNPWTAHSFYGEQIQFCNCIFCGKQVTVNAKPLPNQIDIGGEAVALGCSDETHFFRKEKNENVR